MPPTLPVREKKSLPGTDHARYFMDSRHPRDGQR
jgi:hypothetical protein